MQTDHVKQESRPKTAMKVFWWVLATVAAVPITKWVESQLSFSFFTPAISGLWSWMLSVGAWLNLTASIFMWEFLVITVGAGLMGAGGIWAVYEWKLKVDAAQKEVDKAHAESRAATVKLNIANATLNTTTDELEAAKLELDTARSELNIAHAKITDLQTPKVQPLNEQQRMVLAAIAYYDNTDEECYVKSLSQRIKLTMVETEGAVDVLLKRNLVTDFYSNAGRGVFLTPDGRAYVLQPDFNMSFLPS